MSPDASANRPPRPSKPSVVSVNKKQDSFAAETTQREWWAQRWVDVLESFGWRRRLERARNYVREGRVLKLEFEGAKVFARVQGTADEPYKVRLSLDPFETEQWGFVIEEMSQRAIFTAKLLAGEMPQNIEEAFTASGLSLFPFSKFDIHSRCSCPDPVNPCKHIGAVYYLLGDYFSQDPFILFQLRGRTKESILESLRTLRSEAVDGDGQPQAQIKRQAQQIKLDQSYWSYDDPLDPSLVVITPPPTQETILDVLGPLPIDQLSTKKSSQSQALNSAVMECLKGVYQRASQQAMLNAMRNS
ncbi:MAG: metal-binding protein [Cyanobacteria bacterium P01_F01_bin.42]